MHIFNSIDKKCGANWWKRHWKFVYEYGVGEKKYLKIQKYDEFFFPCIFTWE
jgi:hypothetical protein